MVEQPRLRRDVHLERRSYDASYRSYDDRKQQHASADRAGKQRDDFVAQYTGYQARERGKKKAPPAGVTRYTDGKITILFLRIVACVTPPFLHHES